jgi:predicted amidohydrolase
MKSKTTISRRNFLKNTSAGLGAGLIGTTALSCSHSFSSSKNKLPREVFLAGVDLKGLWPDTTTASRIKRILERMEEIAGLRPDVVCIPECFNTIWISEKNRISDVAEDEKIPGPVTSVIAEFAKKHECYVTCPLITKNEGHFYNSSLLIDRKGNIAGVYHKIHPTRTEIIPADKENGSSITPGALNQPVIVTDFGKVGMQICYDANWSDGWDNLKKQGAEIVLFSSAFPGGRILNHHASKNGYYIVSATGGDARVVDISGNDLDTSSTFVRYAWARINLEKVIVPAWPARDKLPEIFNKYHDRLGIKVWDYTDVITIESLDGDLKVADVLEEFDIQTYDQLLSEHEETQKKYRNA